MTDYKHLDAWENDFEKNVKNAQSINAIEKC